MCAATTARLNTELIYDLQRLGMAGAVLHVGAHPNDEDIGMIAYMARHYGVRTVYWSATRGESGKNRIGSYKDDALGVYRTWESLAAREIDGGEAMYGPFRDFGFSTSSEETLEKWGREELIREIVRAIRMVQPAVVISRWSGTPEDGHGQHSAVGIVVEDAFDAAGDPTRFKGLALPPWQPQKLYVSASQHQVGSDSARSGQVIQEYEHAGFVRVNTGVFDQIANRTYQEQASIAFNSHKTQATNVVPRPGDFYYYYALRKSLVQTSDCEQDLFDGLDATLTSLADYSGASPAIRDSLNYIKVHALTAIEQYRLDRSRQATNALFVALGEIRLLRQQLAHQPLNTISLALDRYLARKEADFESAAVQCLGLRLEGLSDQARVTPKQIFSVSARLWNFKGIPLEDVVFSIHAPAYCHVEQTVAPVPQSLMAHPHATYRVTVAEDAIMTTPYWLHTPHSSFSYVWENTPWDGLPFGRHGVEASCRISVDGQILTLREPIVQRESFVGGFRELPVVVVPPISLHARAIEIFLRVSDQMQQIKLQLEAQSNSVHEKIEGILTLAVPSEWQVNPDRTHVALSTSGDARSLKLSVSIPPNTPAGDYVLRYMMRCDGRDYDMLLEPVRMVAPGLPSLPDETNCIHEEFITTPAEIKVHLVDAS